jgi:Metal binding domain of Ada
MNLNGGSIRYMWEKLKSIIQNDQVFYSFLVLIVGCASFALGRLSVGGLTSTSGPQIEIKTQEVEKVQITQTKAPLSVGTGASEGGLVVVASKTGSKYHLPNCPGASQIKPDNLITFQSAAAATAAGYTPAANCPGLR